MSVLKLALGSLGFINFQQSAFPQTGQHSATLDAKDAHLLKPCFLCFFMRENVPTSEILLDLKLLWKTTKVTVSLLSLTKPMGAYYSFSNFDFHKKLRMNAV